MAILRGNTLQTTSNREFHYWVTCHPVNDGKVFFGCLITEPSKGAFGSLERGSTLEGEVPTGPDCVPLELAIRSRVLSYIERTDFGEWKLPPPSWIGWHGPL